MRNEARPAREAGRTTERPQKNDRPFKREQRPFEAESPASRGRASASPYGNVSRERRARTPEKTQRKPRPARKDVAPAAENIANVEGTVVVSRRGAARLHGGNPWVYRSDVVSAVGVPAGAVAPVTDERGKLIGSALYSTASQIAVRLLSDERIENDEQLTGLIRQRVQHAIEYRKRVVEGTEAYRVVFSEADLLPGLVVDRYNDVLSIQILTQATDRDVVREAVVAELTEHFHPAGIVERVDARIRELENLPPRESGLIAGDKSATTFAMNGFKFHFDGLAGQKTGAYLDQRENYMAAERYAHGEALDVFCYQGGFALHLARACDKVSGVDSSRPALEVAEQNEHLNADELRERHEEIEWIEANAFDLLRDYADTGRQYDTIVLDPPAFAKSKSALETALRGYKELNLRGLKMLRPGGVLVTCSCSHHVSESDFMNMLAEAASDAHRTVRVVEKRTQAKDHPILLSMPETQYLKCVIAIVE